jgi:hypothetical protein
MHLSWQSISARNSRAWNYSKQIDPSSSSCWKKVK